jgi:hypothetical protein
MENKKLLTSQAGQDNLSFCQTAAALFRKALLK